jgi:hypothetical protein
MNEKGNGMLSSSDTLLYFKFYSFVLLVDGFMSNNKTCLEFRVVEFES